MQMLVSVVTAKKPRVQPVQCWLMRDSECERVQCVKCVDVLLLSTSLFARSAISLVAFDVCLIVVSAMLDP